MKTESRSVHVVGIAVASLDGCLTRHDIEGTGFASKADQAFFHAALQTFDCSIAGRRTYEAGRAGILRASKGDRLQVILTHTPQSFIKDASPDHLEFLNAGVSEAVEELARRGRRRCALLGGSALYTEACARGLLDELWITIEPVVFGDGLRLFAGRVHFDFELASSEVLDGSTLLVKYRHRHAGSQGISGTPSTTRSQPT